MRLTTEQMDQARRIIDEKLGGVVDITSDKITYEEAVLLERYVGTPESEAREVVSIARGLSPGDSIEL